MNPTNDVYPPSEDTFFLLDTILQEKLYSQHQLIIEIGTGSGYILQNLLKHHQNAIGIGIDISLKSIMYALQTSILENTASRTMFLVTDLLHAIRPSQSFSPLFIFNPPYLPEDHEIDALLPKHEVLQYTGGKKGHETILNFIHRIRDFPSSRTYFLFSDRALPINEFLSLLPTNLLITISSKISWFYETLYVLRVDPQCQ